MKRASPFNSSESATSPTQTQRQRVSLPPTRPPKVSRRVKACNECHSRKIKCELPSGDTPCVRCRRLGLQCIITKSLQTLLEDEVEWKSTMESRTLSVEAAVAAILQKLDMPAVESYSESDYAIAGRVISDGAASALREMAATIKHDADRSAGSASAPPLRELLPGMAMTRESSQEPEEDNGDDAVVAAPMSSLFKVTKLHNIRSNLDPAEPSSATRPLSQSDIISDEKVPLAEAEELFRIFSCSLNHYLWGGVALVHSDLSSAWSSSPVLTVAILTVTALHMPDKEKLFDLCYAEFLSMVSDSMFARHHSLDDVRGLCIGAFWLSEISWKLSGHAVRIAMEMNMHMSFSRAMRKPGSPQHLDRARLWYLLYVCDHHFSIAYGRPPMIQEDPAITCHESFLQLPGIVQADLRLHSQVAIFLILSRMQRTFGLDVEEPLTDNMVAQLRQFNQDIDNWRIKWETRLSPNDFIASYPAKGVILHYHFAKLQLNALVFRGQDNLPATSISTAQQEFGHLAVLSATSALNFILTEPDICRSVVGVPLYLHTIITFSFMFLVKIHLKWSQLAPFTDSNLLLQLIDQTVTLLNGAKASQRHLCFYIARGLKRMQDKFEAWLNAHSLSRPPHPHHQSRRAAHGSDASSAGTSPHPSSASNSSMMPAHGFQSFQVGMAPWPQCSQLIDVADFGGFDDQYFPIDYFHSLDAHIPG